MELEPMTGILWEDLDFLELPVMTRGKACGQGM